MSLNGTCSALNVGGHYSRVQDLSRIGIVLVTVLTLSTSICASAAPRSAQKSADESRAAASPSADQDPEKVFAEGEAFLAKGDLDAAERSFKRVLVLDPRTGTAYANLGVIDMRRKRWEQALDNLQKAENLAPEIAGIRLNIGLIHYRQGDYRHAIPPLESVVKDVPDSLQARYLLGQCYFFTDRYVEAADTLEPLWPRQSRDLNYLYVLGISADKAERKELGDRAIARMAEVGGDSAEVHLLTGKAMLNLEAYGDAEKELTAAAQRDPNLPFVHFNLGMLYEKKGNYDRAKTEFLKDIALEPDVVFNYDELGNVYFLTDNDAEAEKSYRQALKLEPQMLSPHLGLAKLYQRQAQYEKALAELDAAGKLDLQSSRIHYLRGQVLLKLGRKEEAKKEIDTSVQMSSERREQREKELEGGSLPSPELTQQPK
jgi:tetratricopeptide (TPR) repeat protein